MIHNSTVSGVTARKPHRCGNCRRMAIRPGHRYLRHVLFPGGINSTGRPWVDRQCLACALAVAEEPGTAADDPIMLVSACGRYCHGTEACALHDDHKGEHSCQECP